MIFFIFPIERNQNGEKRVKYLTRNACASGSRRLWWILIKHPKDIWLPTIALILFDCLLCRRNTRKFIVEKLWFCSHRQSVWYGSTRATIAADRMEFKYTKKKMTSTFQKTPTNQTQINYCNDIQMKRPKSTAFAPNLVVGLNCLSFCAFFSSILNFVM